MRREHQPLLGMLDYETTWLRPGRRPRTRFVGVALDDGSYRVFPTTAALVEWMASAPPMRLYHHSDFDLCQMVVDGVVPLDLQVRGTNIVRSKVAGHTLINSYALFPTALKKILEACGYVKRPMGIEDHPRDCPCGPCSDALHERNRSDCVEGLRSILTLSDAYEKDCDVNPVRGGFATAAGCAFAAAEKYAGPLPVYLHNREAFRGGRVEAFRLGACGEAECFDINSSYPASFTEAPPADWLIHAEVQVSRDDAPRPFFADRGEGLKFPAGRFRTWFFASNFERYYEPHGGLQVQRILYKRPVDFGWMRNVLPLLVRIFEGRAATKDEAVRFARKIFYNSIYGRLGLKASRTVTSRVSRIPTHQTCGAYPLPEGGFLVFRDVPSRPKANYAFAAFVADNARARLYDGLRKATDPYYCDTDAVYAAPGNFRPEREGSGLGEWKREGVGDLKIRTVKDYEFGEKVVRKGQNKERHVWTVRLALDKRPVRGVGEKIRRTRYGKRRVRRDGSTAPLIY